MDEAEQVVAFWFAPGMSERWFKPDPALDAEISRRFCALCRACQGRGVRGLGCTRRVAPWPCACCSTSSRATSGAARRVPFPATSWPARWLGSRSRLVSTASLTDAQTDLPLPSVRAQRRPRRPGALSRPHGALRGPGAARLCPSATTPSSPASAAFRIATSFWVVPTRPRRTCSCNSRARRSERYRWCCCAGAAHRLGEAASGLSGRSLQGERAAWSATRTAAVATPPAASACSGSWRAIPRSARGGPGRSGSCPMWSVPPCSASRSGCCTVPCVATIWRISTPSWPS